MKEEHGTSSMSAVSKVMGQMWSRLSGEEKASYYSQAERDRHRYVIEMKSYFSQLYKGNHGTYRGCKNSANFSLCLWITKSTMWQRKLFFLKKLLTRAAGKSSVMFYSV